MIFKRKDSFFLDLSKPAEKPPEKGAARTEPKAAAKPAPPAAPKAPAPEPVQAAVTEPAPAAAAAPATGAQTALTTAQAMAAELLAAEEARPAPTLATFAPECLNPANAVPTRRRKAGANLAGFKAMADEMFRS